MSAARIAEATPTVHYAQSTQTTSDDVLSCHLCGHVINLRGNSWTMDVTKPVHKHCLHDTRGW